MIVLTHGYGWVETKTGSWFMASTCCWIKATVETNCGFCCNHSCMICSSSCSISPAANLVIKLDSSCSFILGFCVDSYIDTGFMGIPQKKSEKRLFSPKVHVFNSFGNHFAFVYGGVWMRFFIQCFPYIVDDMDMVGCTSLIPLIYIRRRCRRKRWHFVVFYMAVAYFVHILTRNLDTSFFSNQLDATLEIFVPNRCGIMKTTLFYRPRFKLEATAILKFCVGVIVIKESSILDC